ncbi:uncharacterized protein L3040_007603 [Drepanopeziza brunnea f. sp. 'multigermtubi']|uniref:uncharacterized protein n=1 Tax=Drepanopeziza brunnea f. sp. 'multigermtubi' TaxID=698441 RepID=UPI0023913C21|nr:hypothetical protein L3040_007603 [Drepanopeziza brunnea f. sp. 'multigermtubi']
MIRNCEHEKELQFNLIFCASGPRQNHRQRMQRMTRKSHNSYSLRSKSMVHAGICHALTFSDGLGRISRVILPSWRVPSMKEPQAKDMVHVKSQEKGSLRNPND